jgi:1,4-dihydroxy-2-naphthoate polyprenyltransferase
MDHYRHLVILAKPHYMVLLLLTYCMGAGIARYLGYPVHMVAIGLGALAVLAVHVAVYWLEEYFHLPFRPLARNETLNGRETLRALLFHSIIAMLTVAGAIVVTLLLVRSLSITSGVIFGLIILLAVVYSLPPARLSDKGFGELILAILWGTLFPAFSFLLQSGEFHRLLTFATFPLTMLALAFLLVTDFPHYAADQKVSRQSLLTRLTWQRAIPIHHLLILFSYLFFSITPYLGFPWGLVWPIFLSLPFGLIQVIWLQRIASGGKALWRYFIPFAAGFYGLSVYVLTLNFWIR